jgi:hypothetical protein
MYLYKFTLTYKRTGTKKTYLKFCRYPKKTKLYKSCMNLLDDDILKRFTYSINN